MNNCDKSIHDQTTILLTQEEKQDFQRNFRETPPVPGQSVLGWTDYLTNLCKERSKNQFST